MASERIWVVVSDEQTDDWRPMVAHFSRAKAQSTADYRNKVSRYHNATAVYSIRAYVPEQPKAKGKRKAGR